MPGYRAVEGLEPLVQRPASARLAHRRAGGTECRNRRASDGGPSSGRRVALAARATGIVRSVQEWREWRFGARTAMPGPLPYAVAAAAVCTSMTAAAHPMKVARWRLVDL